jgi:hypothetical protein
MDAADLAEWLAGPPGERAARLSANAIAALTVAFEAGALTAADLPHPGSALGAPALASLVALWTAACEDGAREAGLPIRRSDAVRLDTWLRANYGPPADEVAISPSPRPSGGRLSPAGGSAIAEEQRSGDSWRRSAPVSPRISTGASPLRRSLSGKRVFGVPWSAPGLRSVRGESGVERVRRAHAAAAAQIRAAMLVEATRVEPLKEPPSDHAGSDGESGSPAPSLAGDCVASGPCESTAAPSQHAPQGSAPQSSPTTAVTMALAGAVCCMAGVLMGAALTLSLVGGAGEGRHGVSMDRLVPGAIYAACLLGAVCFLHAHAAIAPHP